MFFAFVLAFIISHILIAVVAFYGFMVINELFNVQLFSIILGLLLLFLGFNFIGFLNISVKLPKIKFIQNKSFINSFLLGVVCTFSICPSCTGFFTRNSYSFSCYKKYNLDYSCYGCLCNWKKYYYFLTWIFIQYKIRSTVYSSQLCNSKENYWRNFFNFSNLFHTKRILG